MKERRQSSTYDCPRKHPLVRTSLWYQATIVLLDDTDNTSVVFNDITNADIPKESEELSNGLWKGTHASPQLGRNLSSTLGLESHLKK